MSFINLNLEKKIAVSSFVFVVFIIFLIWFFALPSLSSMKKITLDVERQIEYFDYFSDKKRTVENVSESLKKVKPEIEIFNNIFIDEDTGLGFSEDLKKIAEKNQIKADVSLLPEDENNKDVVGIKISGQGDYADFLNYLYSLEHSIYYINIDSITVNSKKDSGIIGFNLTAATYWKK